MPTMTAPALERAFIDESRRADGTPRELYAPFFDWMERATYDEIADRQADAERQAARDSFAFLLDPFRFRPAPIDLLPRLISSDEWELVAAGVRQRQRALNLFLLDLYCGDQQVVPPEVVYTCERFAPDLAGVRPRGGVYVHVYGADLVRDVDGEFVVLEDNLRIPSGIAYQMKTCELAASAFPELAAAYRVEPYDPAPAFRALFASLASEHGGAAVILTDGKYGAAFFEHRYLSELLGVPLVEGQDLYCDASGAGSIRARTLDGDLPVDVIYRRVEDLDTFVPGLRQAAKDGRVALVNAMGSGAADDKLVFLWVPEMIRRYLGEEPILRQPESQNLLDEASRAYALDHLDELVVKSRGGSGGAGVAIGPELSAAELAKTHRLLAERPEEHIAQRMIDFSAHLVLDREAGGFAERRVDLRVFSYQNAHGEVTVPVGGLTRVARAESRITNNSAGGLCKPTWVVSPG